MKLLMLDTDISSYIIRRRPEPLAQHFERHADAICVCVVTAAELRFGVEKSKSVRAALQRIGRPFGAWRLLDF